MGSWMARVVYTAVAVIAIPGCIAGNRPNFVNTGSSSEGKTFYLDGAGNFGFGKESVPIGLAEGGYHGKVEHFIWTSYMGPLVDQLYLRHNRRAARDLARKIARYKRYWPEKTVNIVALSAGTGVAVFALEALDADIHVNNVVLLSSSLSADYDLTQALRRVDGAIHVFWSSRDPILRWGVPIVGTVDRAGFGARPAGTHGMRLPNHVSDQTRKLYERVQNVEWHPDQSGGVVKNVVTLRHATTTTTAFIRELVAPIVIAKAPVEATDAPALAADGNSAATGKPIRIPTTRPAVPGGAAR